MKENKERKQFLNPATGRLVYADTRTGKCARKIDALTRKLAVMGSPPRKAGTPAPAKKSPAPAKKSPAPAKKSPLKGILKAPKNSADRTLLRARQWTRLENAPKTPTQEKALAIARGNRLPDFESPKEKYLDALTKQIVKKGWKMSGEAKKKATELEKESESAKAKLILVSRKKGPNWWWEDKNVKPPKKVKWFKKSGTPAVAEKYEPVAGVKMLYGGKARSKESAERRRVEGGRIAGKNRHVESLQHELDRFSPKKGGLWYPTPSSATVEYKNKYIPRDIPRPPPHVPRARNPKPAHTGGFL